MRRPPSERTLLALVGAVQFVNVVDFMMVMPLGPDFARALGIPASSLGLVGAAYTSAAALAGLAGASLLDRFDRRVALATAMLGLVVATAAGGLATGLGTMLAARFAAGAFGGPATALSLAIVADAVPPERRGKALGAVMGVFSVASVLGVPAGLRLALVGGWRLPFFAVAGLGLAVAGSALALMPPLRAHLDRRAEGPAPGAILRRPIALLSLAATATGMFAAFSLIPNFAAHFQMNLGFPRERLDVAYMLGGTATFVTMRLAGAWVDRAGAPVVAALATALFLAIVALGFAHPLLPAIAVLPAFMIANSSRNVALNALSTRIPGPGERARFLSVQSSVQHLAAAAGAASSSRLLWEEGGRLRGVERVAVVSGALALALPFLAAAVASRLPRR
jgi:predicted MFS family arabinose efflux permease